MRLPLADGGSFYAFVNLDDQDVTLTLNEGPVPVALAIQKQRPAALWFDGKGQLRGVEAQGKVVVNGAPLLVDGVGGIVFSANEKGVGESDELVLLPLQAGEWALHTQAFGNAMNATVGEVKGSRWSRYESLALVAGEDVQHLTVDALNAQRMILLSRPEGVEALEAKVTKMMTDPSFR